MSDYKGFRCWANKFLCLATDSTGVTIEYEQDGTTPTGRLLRDGVFAGYYPNTVTVDGESISPGTRACLEDTCAPLVTLEGNGQGWQLDVELYTRLNAINGSDPAWEPYKTRNPRLWTPSTPTLDNGNPAPKSVRLVPTQYCYAMFFKHTSGYKLMVALPYMGMHCSADTMRGSGNSSDDIYKIDAGFLWNHIAYNHKNTQGSEADNISKTIIGGFVLSMIPPANQGGTQDDWRVEYSIRSENWYPPTMFPLVSQFRDSVSYSLWTDTSTSYLGYIRGVCYSWIRKGTSTVYNNVNGGVLVGTNLKTSLLADSKGNVGLGYLYKSTSNTTIMNPLLFIGPIYKKKIYDYDTLPQRYIASWCYSCLGLYISSSSPSETYNKAWCSYTGAYQNYGSASGTNLNWQMDITNINTGNPASAIIYTAYPAMSSAVYTNYRYSKAGYTTIGLLDEDVLRWSDPTGLIPGQTFNDGDWVYINNTGGVFRAQDGTTASAYLYPSIRWDKEYNGTTTFC